MIIFKQWRLWVSLLLLIGSYIFIKPNFESQTSDSKINFGLDIQGGFSYLLELNEEEYLNNLLVKTSQYIENTYSISSDIDNGEIVISKNQNLDALTNIVIQNLGLEINEKSDKENSYIFSKQSFNKSLSDMTLNAVEIVRSRVDFLGNKELSIQKVGLNKILLEIPGDLDNNVKEVISKTAKLTLHLEKNNIVGSKTFINEETGEQVRVQEIPNITGDFIQDASLQYNQNEPVVAFSFNKEGSDLFAKMTSENVGSRFAIVLDGSLITAPVIRESITGGSGQISGGFTNETANNFNSAAEVDDGSCDFTEEKLDYCPDEINEDNEDLVDDSCLVPADETNDAEMDIPLKDYEEFLFPIFFILFFVAPPLYLIFFANRKR